MMRSRTERENVVQALVDRGWGKCDARIGEQAGYRCEYCDLDFLASADNLYRMWQKDHIVPKFRGGGDDPDNLALCCLPCNMFKGKWDPRRKAGEDANREGLIEAVRVHLFDQRTTKLKEVIRCREIVRPRP